MCRTASDIELQFLEFAKEFQPVLLKQMTRMNAARSLGNINLIENLTCETEDSQNLAVYTLLLWWEKLQNNMYTPCEEVECVEITINDQILVKDYTLNISCQYGQSDVNELFVKKLATNDYLLDIPASKIVTSPTIGTAKIYDSGKITYQANVGVSGTDSFQVQLFSISGISAIANVNVNISVCTGIDCTGFDGDIFVLDCQFNGEIKNISR